MKEIEKFFPQFQRWILRQPIHQILQMRYQNKPEGLLVDLMIRFLKKNRQWAPDLSMEKVGRLLFKMSSNLSQNSPILEDNLN